ncbi:AglZ/HisF2 family acetamidino modification protein [Flavobacteriales bacterium]|nr:AglZ/HisF2 family acetamidino modification protein [Flavobacteriales bacterium]
MIRPRIIPVLLLKDQFLVKTIQFKKPNYIGDPINSVRIFNDLEADEIVFLDINATRENRLIDLDFVRNVGEEANMPFSVGGGIKKLEDVRQIIAAGAERVVIGTYAFQNPEFIKEASEEFGTSTISVCIDYKKNIFGKNRVHLKNGVSSTKYTPADFAKLMQEKGAGELILQSIKNDGMMSGYDIEMAYEISNSVHIPVIALGGAKNQANLKKCYFDGYVNGVAAGSLFVYQGVHKGVLINYPENKTSIFKNQK